jgi:ABC-type Fe3+/spermidine/putrescine transport system ATPase subunit
VDIELRKINKSFKGRTVLNDLCLKIPKGDFHVLLGPSGNGKTTLLSIIAGVVQQDQGDVFIGGRNVNGLAPGKRKIGMAYQNFALFPHLTVFENVAYGLRVRKIKKNLIGKRVIRYLSEMQIQSEKDKYPHQLSGGQKQRVALARALVTGPDILLLDEPMSSLDPLTKEKIGAELKRLQQKSGMTTLYVTHDQEEAALLGNRVSVIHNGKIEQVETPAELFYHPKTEFVAHFVGVDNVLEVSITDTDTHEAVGWICNERLNRPAKIRVKKYPIIEKQRKAVKLCIHPEKIALKKKSDANHCKENMLEGTIATIARGTRLVKTAVDIGGVMLQAAIPKHLFNFELKENVRVCFSVDALHPLCGKRCRSPKSLRQCIILKGLKLL